MTRHNEAQKIGKIKSIIDFDENRTKSIKSVAIKKIHLLNSQLGL